MRYFIEIGCNSYDTLLHLCDEGWTGVLIEPIKEEIEKIIRFDLKNCFYENCAISEKGGDIEFFFVPGATDWSSLSESHIRKINPDCEIQKRIVPSKSFDQLAEKYNFPQIDFLKIDAEGSDYMILKSIDYNKHRIAMIKFEHHHMTEDQLQEISILMDDNFFELLETKDLNSIYLNKNVN